MAPPSDRSPHFGRYRRLKDWRQRVLDTALGTARLRVPRVVACMCFPQPLDDAGDIQQYRETLCPIEKLLAARRLTPELSYLCTRPGAQLPYRGAAHHLRELSGVRQPSHTRVRRETLKIGPHIEDRQFELGWSADGRRADGVARPGLAIDSTCVTGSVLAPTSKIEIVAGRIEGEGRMGQRFACAVMSRPLTRVLVAAALRQSGRDRRTEVEAVNDGARGMRSLVTAIAPRVGAPKLDWFHLAMKLQAVRSTLFSHNCILPPPIVSPCRPLWAKIRNSLWRGRGTLGIELARTLAASLTEAVPQLPRFCARAAETACGATMRLMAFSQNNAEILVNHARARADGRRISTAPAESVMNHLINRRMSKRQQMRWSAEGAHQLLQTRVELQDGQLAGMYEALWPHSRTPEPYALQ